MKNNLYLGAILALLSALSYSTLVLVIKMTSTSVSVPVLVFIQSVVCLVLVMPVLMRQHGHGYLRHATFSVVKRQHLLRTVFSLGISYFLFAAVRHLSYFDSILLYNTFPLFIPFVALVILRGKINHALWPFILCGFLGVGLTLHLDSAVFSLPVLYAIGSALSAALSIVMMRKISQTDDSIKSLYHYFLYSVVISGVVAIPSMHELMTVNWPVMIAIGVLFFLVQYFLTLATTHTTPAVVSNLYYSNIIFSLVLSHVFLGDELTLQVLLGMVFIIFGGLGVMYMQRRYSKKAVQVNVKEQTV